ncbi:SDR family NAD(P)-dependent oxidoreductase [Nocardia fluminea]|uniref:SDR family NAD(P)-dependent oxidoreductase n=1 Tax=Nocardia fluminea TaxID=134984 RepID=UPI00366C3042
MGELSSHVDWSVGGVEVVSESRAWPETGRPRRAGVSSFGISGTNAHVIVEQAPEVDGSVDVGVGAGVSTVPLVLSGKTPDALHAQAVALREMLAGDDNGPALADIAWTLATARSRFSYRAVVNAPDRSSLDSGLDALTAGTASAAVHQGLARTGPLAMVFAGQGSQRAGMGRELYDSYEVFAASLDEVCGHIDPLLDRSLRDVIFAEPQLLDRTEYTQPGLFAVEYALFRLLFSWGVVPDYVIGHSIGEITAACVAEAISVPDAARVVVARGRLMQQLPSNDDHPGLGGSMVALEATEVEVQEHLCADVDLAAVNGPMAVVISGATDAVDRIAALFAARGRRTKSLTVSHAFHSAFLEPILAEFDKVCADIVVNAPRIPVVSNLTGMLLTAEDLASSTYWARHARETVRFSHGIQALADRGVTRYLAVDPSAALVPMVQECLSADEHRLVVATLRTGRSEPEAMLSALAELYVDGVPIAWGDVLGGGRIVDLPTYSFQRERFWASAARQPTRAVDSDLYRLDWVPIAMAGSHGPAVPGCAIVGDIDRTTASFAAHHRDLDALLAAAVIPENVIVQLLASSGEQPQRAHAGARAGLDLVQAWLREPRFAHSRLVLVTRGAVAVELGADQVDLGHAPVWGLVRSVRAEHPDRIVLVDLDEQVLSDHVLATVLASGEAEVAVRGDRFDTGRLAALDPRTGVGRAFDPEATVLVTGASGALGSVVARHLAARHEVRHLLLVSRRGPESPELARLQTELAEQGVEVEVAACDIADRAAVAELLERIPRRLGAIVHLAGLLDDAAVLSLDHPRLAEVLRPKVDGAWHLHDLTRERDLDQFILFSSAAATVGTAGQANYNAANAFLDALAHQRHAWGLPATSMAWGLWADAGMGGRLDAAHRRRLTRIGAVPLTAGHAMKLFDAMLGGAHPVPVPLPLDPATLAVTSRADLPVALHGLAKPAPVAPTSVLRDIGTLAPERRREVVLRSVIENVAAVLGHSSAVGITASSAFTELGFDSLTAVELRNRLVAQTGLALAPSLVFDHPTPVDLADLLTALLVPEQARPGDRAMVELDSLERMLLDVDPDDHAVSEIAGRLQSMLWKLQRGNNIPALSVPTASTADDILEFIDREFGELN